MRKLLVLCVVLTLVYLFTAAVADAQETFTGTVFKYGSGRYTGMRTSGFTLKLNSTTPDDQAQRYLSSLQEGGQDALLKSIHDNDLGRFALTGELARTIIAVRVVNTGGTRKIYAIFERWEQFAELRGGYRSLDYPFGYIELTIDSRTGKGSGQYFAAAKIRWVKEKKGEGSHVEIEDYATFPAKLVNVETKGVRP